MRTHWNYIFRDCKNLSKHSPNIKILYILTQSLYMSNIHDISLLPVQNVLTQLTGRRDYVY
jgi:hypothetical protein